MSNERDELRGALSNTICNALNYPDRAQPHLLGGDMSTVLDKTADSLLAAGYCRPRTDEAVERVAQAIYTANPIPAGFLGGSEPVPWERLGNGWKVPHFLTAKEVIAALLGEGE